MNEKAIATLELSEQEQAELAVFLEDPDILKTTGADEIANEDLALPPYVKVSSRTQPTEIDGIGEIPAGELVVMPAGAIHGDCFDIVVISTLDDTFAYWDKYENNPKSPFCTSDERGMIPMPFGGARIVTNPQAGPCRRIGEKGKKIVTCPFAQWGETDPETGKSAKPECARAIGFAIWFIDEDNDGAVMRLRRSAIPLSARPLNSIVKKVGVTHRITMTTRLAENELGKWYVPMFTKGKRLTHPELYRAIQLKKEWEGFTASADYDRDEFDDYVPDADADVIDGEAKEMPF